MELLGLVQCMSYSSNVPANMETTTEQSLHHGVVDANMVTRRASCMRDVSQRRPNAPAYAAVQLLSDSHMLGPSPVISRRASVASSR